MKNREYQAAWRARHGVVKKGEVGEKVVVPRVEIPHYGDLTYSEEDPSDCRTTEEKGEDEAFMRGKKASVTRVKEDPLLEGGGKEEYEEHMRLLAQIAKIQSRARGVKVEGFE